MRTLFALAVLLCSVAQAETTIKAPETIAPYLPIVVKAETQGSVCLWRVSEATKYISLEDGKLLHVWAPPGKHTLELTAIIVDWDKKKISAEQATATITVTGDVPTPPNPPNPPDPPQPTTAPWAAPGLTVVILREAQSEKLLPPDQQAIFTSTVLRQWIAKHVVKLEDGFCGFRIWDDDSDDLVNVPQVLKNAYPVVKHAMQGDIPVIGISNGKTGYVGPLPGTVDETIKLLEKYQ